jgi:hypothetical protein
VQLRSGQQQLLLISKLHYAAFTAAATKAGMPSPLQVAWAADVQDARLLHYFMMLQGARSARSSLLPSLLLGREGLRLRLGERLGDTQLLQDISRGLLGLPLGLRS